MEMNVEISESESKSESVSESVSGSYIIKNCVINYCFLKENNRPIEIILTDGTLNLKKRNTNIYQFTIYPNNPYEKKISCFAKEHILRIYYNTQSEELSATAEYNEISYELYGGGKIFIKYDIILNLNY